MKIDPLIKMANQISDFFAGEGTPEEAPKLVAVHIRRYWEQRMRREIYAYVERDGEGLDDVALAAIRLLAAQEAQEAAGTQSAPPAGTSIQDAG